MNALLRTWDGFEKTVDVNGEKPPSMIRVKREHRDCPRHPKWTVKTYTEEIKAQKDCCWNDQFGQMSDRVFAYKGEVGETPVYEEVLRT